MIFGLEGAIPFVAVVDVVKRCVSVIGGLATKKFLAQLALLLLVRPRRLFQYLPRGGIFRPKDRRAGHTYTWFRFWALPRI